MRNEKNRRKILDALQDTELTTHEVADSTEMKMPNAYRYLQSLESQGKVKSRWFGQFLWSLMEDGK